VLVVDVMEVTLANCGAFMRWHAYDVEVASTWYMKGNGIPSPSNNDIDNPQFIPILIRCCFGLYFLGNHIFTIMICSPFYGGFVSNLDIFITFL
jgi:hypothetical protein